MFTRRIDTITAGPWICVRRTDAEAEAPIFWPLDVKSWLIGKDPDTGKDRGQEEKQKTGWDGWMAIIDSMDMNLSKLREIVKDWEAWRASPWGHKESYTTEWLNNSSSGEIISAMTFSMYFRERVWHGWLIKSPVSKSEGWSKWWHNMLYFITQYIWVFSTKFSFINKYHGKYLFSIFYLKPKQKIL